MNKNIKLLIDESINLEMNVARLYEFFANAFPEDKSFWWELVIEEKNHAALFRAGEDSYLEVNYFPSDLLSNSLEQISQVNENLTRLIENYENKPPSRETAFNTAFKLEQSAGEIHFQDYMQKDADSEMDRIFKRLNQDDKDHAERIFNYMQKHEIQLREDILPNFLKI